MTETDQWWVYVLSSQSASRTYVGITVDRERRLAQHNGELPGGARATRAGRPWTLATCYGPFDGRRDALRAEYRVKRERGPERLELETGELLDD
jgi:predicted GIY-YIG superfamily endonuclease